MADEDASARSEETMHMPSDPQQALSTDLVAYVIITVPSVPSLAILAPALAELVERETISVLDAVVVEKDVDGAVNALELDAVHSMESIRHLGRNIGGMLSEHDLAMASTALRTGSAALLLVTEDRWATPLSTAAHRAGGEVIAGERIPALRVESALAERADHDHTGAP